MIRAAERLPKSGVRAWRQLRSRLRTGVFFLLAIAAITIIIPNTQGYDPLAMIDGHELAPPSAEHWFGTDEFGRDILQRVVGGLRISLGISVLSVALGSLLGTVFGWVAGYWGGWTDSLIMRVTDALLAFPAIFIGIAVTAILGPGYINTAIAIAIVNVPIFARIARASVLSEREFEYTEAARALGESDARVLFRHIAPNTLSPLIIQAANGMAYAVILESGLGFLGLGAQPPTPSLGTILRQSQMFLNAAPWYAFLPGIVLTLFIYSLNLLADGLREQLDPKIKGR